MKLPDGPLTPPFLQLIQWLTRPLKYLDACAQRYGDPFTAQVSGFPPYVIFSNPQAIQEIFTAAPSQFESGSGNASFRPLLGEHSLLLLNGDRHQRQRRLLTPPFHGERMRAYGKLICGVTEQVMSQWMIDQPFPVRLSMQEISLRVILRAVFGIDEGERFQQLRQLLSSLLDSVSSPLSSSLFSLRALQQDLGPWSPWGRFLRQKQLLDRLIYAELQERRAQPNSNREDILSLMMSARDETGQAMADVELRDQLMTLLVAGHETTATALAWALYWIHHLPEVHQRLLQELDTLNDNSDPSEISRLPYLTAVCSETLRIYPPVLFAFPRIVKSPLQLMGYQFDTGTVLAPCIYLTHHREELYPEAKRFKPERFLERQFSPYEYLPFGGSNRRCIGMAFAQFEMKLVLATVLSHLQLATADKRPIRPVRRGVTVATSGGMRIVVTSQRQNIPVRL
jgi:cytochrome P450